MSQVVAIVISYYPDIAVLRQLISALSKQAVSAVVVDNGSPPATRLAFSDLTSPGVEWLSLMHNCGIAAAQNVGIAWARSRGATHVLLLDQDSEPAPQMVARLLEAAETMAAQGHRVAAIGPRYLDERRNNPPPFIRIRGLRVMRSQCATPDAVLPVDYLIASGCLIPIATLDAVGGMREDLFIDYVDIEWGLRARQLGYQSFGACAAKMRHSLGEAPLSFLGLKVPLHSPLRHYYLCRNAVLLYRQRWIPLQWKLADGYRLLLKYVFYSLFARPRMAHLRMMSFGIWHGLKGFSGSWDAATDHGLNETGEP